MGGGGAEAPDRNSLLGQTPRSLGEPAIDAREPCKCSARAHQSCTVYTVCRGRGRVAWPGQTPNPHARVQYGIATSCPIEYVPGAHDVEGESKANCKECNFMDAEQMQRQMQTQLCSLGQWPSTAWANSLAGAACVSVCNCSLSGSVRPRDGSCRPLQYHCRPLP